MKDKKLMGLGIFTAVAAGLCCITPVLAMLAGIGGIAATFSWIEPFRPYLIGLTVFILGFAWYQKLKPQGDVDCVCDDEKTSFWQGKSFLGLISVFAILMMAFPMYSGIFYGTNVKASENLTSGNAAVKDNKNDHSKVVFAVDGMTCDSCEAHVESEVSKLDGVTEVNASFKDGNTTVVFDNKKVTENQIKEAIDSTGYTAKKIDILKESAIEGDKQYENVVFVVGGMTCTGCERPVEDAVSKVDGVSSVKASYKDRKATITFDKSKTTAEEIRKSIDATGYEVKSKE